MSGCKMFFSNFFWQCMFQNIYQQAILSILYCLYLFRSPTRIVRASQLTYYTAVHSVHRYHTLSTRRSNVFRNRLPSMQQFKEKNILFSYSPDQCVLRNGYGLLDRGKNYGTTPKVFVSLLPHILSSFSLPGSTLPSCTVSP